MRQCDVISANRLIDRIAKLQRLIEDLTRTEVSTRYVQCYDKTDPSIKAVYGDGLSMQDLDDMYNAMRIAGIKFIEDKVGMCNKQLAELGIEDV